MSVRYSVRHRALFHQDKNESSHATYFLDYYLAGVDRWLVLLYGPRLLALIWKWSGNLLCVVHYFSCGVWSHHWPVNYLATIELQEDASHGTHGFAHTDGYRRGGYWCHEDDRESDGKDWRIDRGGVRFGHLHCSYHGK